METELENSLSVPVMLYIGAEMIEYQNATSAFGKGTDKSNFTLQSVSSVPLYGDNRRENNPFKTKVVFWKSIMNSVCLLCRKSCPYPSDTVSRS